MSVETVEVTIDSQKLTVPKGTLVIEAARQAGVMIPHFCYHPKLKPDAKPYDDILAVPGKAAGATK